MSVVDSLRQPEYTGENRCTPCTAFNLVVTAALAAAVWIRLDPLAAVVVFALGAATIYFRGYLVPGTPTLTKRYLPAPVLRAFGKEPLSDRTVRSVGDDAPSERWLVAAGALEDADGWPTLNDTFAERWEKATDAVAADVPSESALCDVLGTDDVSKHAETAAVVDGSRTIRWISPAAMRADVAASRLFEGTVDGWEDVPPERRIELFRDLRLFARTCPDCGGAIELDEWTVDPCCERPHTMLEALCAECSTSLADEAVVGVDEDVPARVRAIRG